MRNFDWLKYGIFFVGLVLLALGVGLFFIPRVQFVEFGAEILGLSGQLGKIQQLLITEGVFHAVQSICLLSGIFVLGFHQSVTRFLKSTATEIWVDLSFLLSILYSSYLTLGKTERRFFWLFIVLIVSARLIVLCQYELLVDEAFSYVFFVSNGFLVTTSYYPGPNNHILYNLICCLFDLFPFSAYWVMKLPAFIISTCVIMVLFLYLNKKFGVQVAFIGAVILVSQELFFTYSFLGRGYVLMALATLISMIAFEKWVSTRQTAYRTAFVVASVAGFYTIPVFVYPFSAFLLMGFVYCLWEKDKGFYISFFQAIVWSLVLVACLYFPVVLFNGLSAIISNSWVQPIPMGDFIQRFPAYIVNFYAGITGIHFVGAAGMLFLLLIFLFKKAHLPVYYVFLFTVPLVILLVQRVFPYDRVWVYFTVVNSCLIAYLVNFFQVKWVKNLALGCFLVLGLVVNVHKSSEKISGIAGTDQICRKLVNSQYAKVYTNDDAYNIFLRLAFLEGKNPLDLDVLEYKKDKVYDLLILSKTLPRPESLVIEEYRELFENKFVSVYDLK